MRVVHGWKTCASLCTPEFACTVKHISARENELTLPHAAMLCLGGGVLLGRWRVGKTGMRSTFDLLNPLQLSDVQTNLEMRKLRGAIVIFSVGWSHQHIQHIANAKATRVCCQYIHDSELRASEYANAASSKFIKFWISGGAACQPGRQEIQEIPEIHEILEIRLAACQPDSK